MISNLMARIEANPMLWILLALFVFAEYNLYKRGSELTLVCQQLYRIPDDLVFLSKPRNDRQRAERICIDRLQDPPDSSE